MTEPQRSRRLDGNVRGLIVLGVAVLIGFLLLAKPVTTAPPPSPRPAPPTPRPRGPRVTTARTATTAAERRRHQHPRAQLDHDDGRQRWRGAHRHHAGPGQRVGGRPQRQRRDQGRGLATTDKIKAKGYKTLEAGNAAPVDKTVVYYTEGFQADANAVAGVLGLAPTSVSAAPANPPAGSTGANVIVVLGKDTPPAT